MWILPAMAQIDKNTTPIVRLINSNGIVPGPRLRS
jgi:hypothetical protein